MNTDRTSAETPENRTSRAAEQRRLAAARSRAYRQRKRRLGAPNSRVVDAAWSEACCFHICAGGYDRPLDLRDVLTTARLILEREGYGTQPSVVALSVRIGRVRDLHTWPDSVPSHAPDPGRPLRPTKAGKWSTPEKTIRRHLDRIAASRTDSAGTPVTTSYGNTEPAND